MFRCKIPFKLLHLSIIFQLTNASSTHSSNGDYKSVANPVDACQNFYEFVCGNVARNSRISNQSSLVNDATVLIRHGLFQDNLNIKPADLRAFNMMKRYYESCFDQDEENIKPVQKILQDISGWPIVLGNNWDESKFDWFDTVDKITELFPIFFPFAFSAQIHHLDPTKFIIHINNAFSPIYETPRSTPVSVRQNILKSYRALIQSVSVIFGAPKNASTVDQIKKMIKFERDLNNLKQSFQTPSNKHESTIRELSDNYPNIPWFYLLSKSVNPIGIFVDHSDSVYVLNPSFFMNLDNLLKRTPKRVLANYLNWIVVYSVLPYMNERLRMRYSKFYSILTGKSTVLKRQLWCENNILDNPGFSIGVAALYARNFSDKRVHESVIGIFNNVKSQVRKRFKQVNWLDEATRRAAIEKLEAINVIISLDDELKNDEKIEEYYQLLEVKSKSYFQNAMNLRLFAARQNYKLWKKPVSLNKWMSSQNVASVNAYYMYNLNTVVLSGGMVNAFFKLDRPNYVNYGKIGTIIGHEIFHGFDHTRRRLDKNGYINNWWQREAESTFDEKARCFIEQYNNITSKQVVFQTLDENIADNGGFKAAYHAYNDCVKQNGETEDFLTSLPTQRQMFWINAASILCENYLSYSVGIRSNNNYSSNEARVNIAFSNIKEFSDDFGCKTSSLMNRREKCVLW